MQKCKYGDIILVDFNPVKGAEISKIRPCVVVSHNMINKNSPLIIVIPITSNIQRILPYHVYINKTRKNGLKENSKALSEQIKSLDVLRVQKKLGILESNLLTELEEKIAFVINQKELI